MSAAGIAAIVLLVLFLLGQVRVGAQAEYGDAGPQVWARVGAIRVQVFPLRKKAKKKAPKKPKKTQETPQKSPENPAPEEKKTKKNLPLDAIFAYVQALLPIVLEATGQFKRKLKVDTFVLKLTLSAQDPADMAQKYGQANALLGAVWYPLTQALQIEDGLAHIDADFEASSDKIEAKAALSLKIWQILWLLIYFGVKALRAALPVRKAQKIQQKQRKAA